MDLSTPAPSDTPNPPLTNSGQGQGGRSSILPRKAWLLVGVLIIAGGLVSISVGWWWWSVTTLPPWMGVGEWQKCAEKVPVQPEQAIRASAQLRGLSFPVLRAEYDIFASAIYVNRSGEYGGVHCAISTTTVTYTTPKFLSTTFPEDHFGWRVSFQTRSDPTIHDWQIVDWFTGELFAWGRGSNNRLDNSTSRA